MKLFKLHFSKETQLRLAWLLLAVATLIYVIWISYESVLRYTSFTATAFDLGNMDQAIWNTIHGHPFAFTNQGIDYYGPPIRLAVHFEPILLPLSVLYIFHGDPRILLVFQTLAMATGSIPVFLMTRKYVPQWPLAATAMAGAYLFSPTLLGVNLFDFHAVALATPLLLYALLALENNAYFWLLVTCALASMCKEEIPAVVAMIGLLAIWKYKKPRLGTLLFVAGIGGSIVAFLTIKHFFPGNQSNNFWYRYEALGSTPQQAIVNILLHPWILVKTYFSLDRLYYLVNMFRNVGFLPLLAPEWLLGAVPDMAINLMSTDPLLYGGVYHYNAPVIPFVMISAIHGLRRAVIIWQRWRGEEPSVITDREIAQSGSPVLPAFVVRPGAALWSRIKTAYAGWRANPEVARVVDPFAVESKSRWRGFNERMGGVAKNVALPRLQWFLYGWLVVMIGLNFVVMYPPLSALWASHTPGPREQHIQQLLDLIPADAPVSAGGNINPHLTDRQYVTLFPQITYQTDNQTKGTVQYVIVDMNGVFPEDRVSVVKELNQLMLSQQFKVVARADGVILLARQDT